jgi:hypothetical protein
MIAWARSFVFVCFYLFVLIIPIDAGTPNCKSLRGPQQSPPARQDCLAAASLIPVRISNIDTQVRVPTIEPTHSTTPSTLKLFPAIFRSGSCAISVREIISQGAATVSIKNLYLSIWPITEQAVKDVIKDCVQDSSIYLGGSSIERVVVQGRVCIFRVAVSRTIPIGRSDKTTFTIIGEAADLQNYHIYDTANELDHASLAGAGEKLNRLINPGLHPHHPGNMWSQSVSEAVRSGDETAREHLESTPEVTDKLLSAVVHDWFGRSSNDP